MIEVEQPAQPFAPPDRSDRHPIVIGRHRAQELVPAPLVVPLKMVVLDMLRHQPPQVRFTERHHAAETLSPNRADEALREGVQIGTSSWQTDRRDTAHCEQSLETCAKQRIPVMDQVSRAPQQPIDRIKQRAQRIDHPAGAGGGGAAAAGAGGGGSGGASGKGCASADILCLTFEDIAAGSMPTAAPFQMYNCAGQSTSTDLLVEEGKGKGGGKALTSKKTMNGGCNLLADLGEHAELG